MKSIQNKRPILSAGILSVFCSFGTFAADHEHNSPMNQDQVKGRVEETKGKVKEVTGKILDDKGMEVEGNIQKNLGKAQKGYGDIKQDIKEGK
ncbi:CsbD family protein [Methylomonas koyamae]|uniref:CsbD family protein n=1 Tax=Methylomonas koyamae TaxID=702114 RepID=UPI00112B8A59|nr:CsbD family protein [Methylomonas koyamae]TPQ24307.1 CsbD family protein [Methylomonas koyamae]